MSKIACVFSVDDAYVVPFQVFYHSMEATNSIPDDVRVIILHSSSLGGASLAILRDFLGRYRRDVLFLDVSHVAPEELPLAPRNHFSPAIYYRLFIDEIVPDTVDTVVYLDSDMIAVGSARDLFAPPEKGSLMAAVDQFSVEDSMRIWGARGGTYFQSGVLVIPVNQWRELRLADRFRHAIPIESHRFVYPDQDLLNIVLDGKISRLPIGFNLETSLRSRLSDEVIAEQARIIHFSGPWKPWNNYSFSPFFAAWDKNYQEAFGRPFDRKALLPSRSRRLKDGFMSRVKGLIYGR